MTTVPTALATWIHAHPRSEAILEHGFRLDIGSWNERLGNLRGGPLAGEEGSAQVGLVSRGGLFTLARAARVDETGVAALHLFWQSLAWGTGTNHRNTTRRIASIAADQESAALLLRDATRLACTDSAAAFRLLQPHRPALKYWGPNFFTKYLYFSGAGDINHPCLIVDARVLATLYDATLNPGFKPQSTTYTVGTYLAACGLMRDWADELSSPDRLVGPDEVERWAFSAGKDWRSRRKV